MSKSTRTLTPRVFMQLLIFVVLTPCLPLLITWRWNWWEAWSFAMISILGFIISRWLAARRHPDILAERAKFMDHQDTKPWDKLLAPLLGLGGGLIPLVAGLDVRFGWSAAFGLTVKLIMLALILLGYAIGAWALIENRFFSGTVRIQTERDHQVVSSGPYSVVRHPGYASALLTYLATPLFLDAVWAFIPVAFIITVLVIRTHLEDQTLQEELPGYREYAARTRCRLLPGIW